MNKHDRMSVPKTVWWSTSPDAPLRARPKQLCAPLTLVQKKKKKNHKHKRSQTQTMNPHLHQQKHSKRHASHIRNEAAFDDAPPHLNSMCGFGLKGGERRTGPEQSITSADSRSPCAHASRGHRSSEETESSTSSRESSVRAAAHIPSLVFIVPL